MPEIPRLNGVIRALEKGKTAFVGFAPVDVETASALASSSYDGIAFEMEHAPMSAPALRDALQFMLDRRQILESGTLAPKVTPMVRIPPNGNEMNQWIAKQVLDIGVFGIIFPHVSTVDEARNAIGACRYPKLRNSPLHDPPGIRGNAPVRAARYWGLSQQEYYARADVWPLVPQGEILAIIQCGPRAGPEAGGASVRCAGNRRQKETPTMLQGKMRSLTGQEVDLSQYQGQVLLIVNVASACGYTPQYKGLQALYHKYGARGFTVLGFPCNQFGHQEPGTAEQIAQFCQRNYGVTFDMFEKVDVNGRNQCDLYKLLTSPDAKYPGPIEWNFEKFLIARDGTVVGRFGSGVAPESKSLVEAIKRELKRSA